ncbi:MAG: class I SAM-dependent methyltransferase [Nanoarchaeota archaeon]
MVDSRKYFKDVESWDGAYEGKHGNDLLTKIANKTIRKNILLKRKKTVFDMIQPVKDKTVVDVGCGSGRFSFDIMDAGAKSVTGLDCNKPMIDYANSLKTKSVHSQKMEFIVDDASTYKIKSDVAMLIGVVGYYKDYRELLNNVTNNKHEFIMFDFLTNEDKGVKTKIINSMVSSWAKVRSLEVYKHSKKDIISYMKSKNYGLVNENNELAGTLLKFKLSTKGV